MLPAILLTETPPAYLLFEPTPTASPIFSSDTKLKHLLSQKQRFNQNS